MKTLLRMFILLALTGMVVLAAGGMVKNRIEIVSLSIVTTGDTAQVTKFTPIIGVDSFTYIDTFSFWNASDSTDTTKHSTVKWTSPVQSMRLNVTFDSTSTYKCSLDLGTFVRGFDFDATTIEAGKTLEKLIDSLVDTFNKVVTMKDTVKAEDSVTYIKLVSLMGQRELENNARWTVSPITNFDTVSTWATTIADVCDSLVGSINAVSTADSLATFLTAYDSTTFYITQSDDAGLLYWDSSLNHVDTSGTIARSQANVTSWSTLQDTLGLERLVYPDRSYNALMARIIISPSALTNQGFGLLDSGYIWLYTTLGNKYYLIDSAFRNALPCTLLMSITNSTAGRDTLFKEDLIMVYRITDSVSDTTATADYNIGMSYILKY